MSKVSVLVDKYNGACPSCGIRYITVTGAEQGSVQCMCKSCGQVFEVQIPERRPE